MTLLEEIQELQEGVEKAKATFNQAQGRLEVAKTDIKNAGYKSISSLREAVETKTNANNKAKIEVQKKLAEWKTKYEHLI